MSFQGNIKRNACEKRFASALDEMFGMGKHAESGVFNAANPSEVGAAIQVIGNLKSWMGTMLQKKPLTLKIDPMVDQSKKSPPLAKRKLSPAVRDKADRRPGTFRIESNYSMQQEEEAEVSLQMEMCPALQRCFA